MADYIRRYSELMKLTNFDERFAYLKLSGQVGINTFGSRRYLNQEFYTSNEWRSFRDKIILRDLGCDLGVEGLDIFEGAVIHHLNPIKIDDFAHMSGALMDPENVICCSGRTHRAIHYGSELVLPNQSLVIRKPNDTCPWRTR